MMKYLFNLVLLIASIIFLHGCKSAYFGDNPGRVGELRNFQKVLVKGGDFWITTYQKITNKQLPYVFYVEGDGAAFNGKYKISNDPTPRRGMFINLAAMDERPNVVYIARPCQYTPMNLNPKCTNQYWTNKRLSDDSVQAINDVINSINDSAQKFSLVGYSGGGGIAVLIAARNPRVKDIITIAGTLDTMAFTSYHNVPPMVGSLNPIDYVEKVKNIPQLHISGGKDDIMPPFIADKFVHKASSRCVKQKIFEAASHRNGWLKLWEYIYKEPVSCY